MAGSARGLGRGASARAERAERRACCWAEEERGRVREWAELGGSRAAVRGKRVGRAGVSEGKEVSWAAGWFVELGWADFGSLGWFDSSLFLLLFPFLFYF